MASLSFYWLDYRGVRPLAVDSPTLALSLTHGPLCLNKGTNLDINDYATWLMGTFLSLT